MPGEEIASLECLLCLLKDLYLLTVSKRRKIIVLKHRMDVSRSWDFIASLAIFTTDLKNPLLESC